MAGKKVVSTIDGKPEKRIFRSIIADYDLKTGLCELVDNALDHWTASDKKQPLSIEITLDAQRQLIKVTDDAGGIKENDLRLLVSPGASRGETGQDLIGIFGVGGKRAGVALGELVEIRTRFGKAKTFQIDINADWLASEDWDIEYYQTSPQAAGTTSVEISKLRQSFSAADVDLIRNHLAETYSWFLQQGCKIALNGKPIKPKTFDAWCFPPTYLPRRVQFKIWPTSDQSLDVEIKAGLISDRDPEEENYGVYFFCNNRLIVKEMRTREVGYFITAEAGVPHPDASLCRVVVRIDGPPELMPWNSSKSGVNIAHPAFGQLRNTIISLVSYYSKLSRRWKSDWRGKVFKHKKGKFEDVDADDIIDGKQIVMPKLPRGRKAAYPEQLLETNKAKITSNPYVSGLLDAMAMVYILRRQKLATKNRAALILLDSNFEIALKEFIVSETKLFPPQQYNDSRIASLFKQRTSVINEIKPHVPSLTDEMCRKIRFYYGLRNKLIHERTTIPISDEEVADYEKTIEAVLRILFKVRFPRK